MVEVEGTRYAFGADVTLRILCMWISHNFNDLSIDPVHSHCTTVITSGAYRGDPDVIAFSNILAILKHPYPPPKNRS